MHPGHPNDPRQRLVPLFYTGNKFVLLDGRWSNPNFITYMPHHYGVYPMHYYPQAPAFPHPAYHLYPFYHPPPVQPLMNPFPQQLQQPNRYIHPATALPPIPPPSRPPSRNSHVSSDDYVTEAAVDEELKETERQKKRKKRVVANRQQEAQKRDDEEEKAGPRRDYATDHEDSDKDGEAKP